MINTKQQTMHKLENNLFYLGTKQFETKTDNGTVLIKIKMSHSCNTYLIFLGLIIAISFTLRIREKLKQLLLSPNLRFYLYAGFNK